MAMEIVQLFGGAIEVKLPKGILDASTIRQIPDNQEVFLSTTSDDSIIIELLQPAPMEEHFEDITELNQSSKVEMLEKSDIFIARLDCQKFNKQSSIVLTMGKVTVTEYDCDIVVTINSQNPQRQLLVDILASLVVKDPSLFQ